MQGRFRSKSFHVMDDKGRVNLPSRFREVLRLNGPEVLMVSPWEDHLRAYLPDEWEKTEDRLMNEGVRSGLGDLARVVVGGVVESVLDKQGRIRLSAELRDDVNITKEIALIGMVKWIEIWDKDTVLAKAEVTRENFADHKAKLAEIGIL